MLIALRKNIPVGFCTPVKIRGVRWLVHLCDRNWRGNRSSGAGSPARGAIPSMPHAACRKLKAAAELGNLWETCAGLVRCPVTNALGRVGASFG